MPAVDKPHRKTAMSNALLRTLTTFSLALFFVLPTLTLADQNPGERNGSQPIAVRTYLWEAFPEQSAPLRYTQSSGGNLALPRYEPPKLRYLDSDNQSHPLQLSPRRLSPAHRYRGPSDFIIVRETPGDEGEPPFRTTVGQARLPEDADSVILFLFPVKNAATEQYNIVTIRNSTRDIPSGSAQIINLSEEQLAVSFDGEVMLAKPGIGKQIDLSSVKNHRLAVIIGSRDHDGHWQRRHVENIVISPDASALFFLYKDGDSYRIALLANHRQTASRE